MRSREIQYAIFLVGIGVSLIAYAHANFATKNTSMQIREDIREIRSILWEVKKVLHEKNN